MSNTNPSSGATDVGNPHYGFDNNTATRFKIYTSTTAQMSGSTISPPAAVVIDFGTTTSINSYTWTTADDSPGRIEFNAHRVYGSLMFSHLCANWKQKWRGPPGGQVVHVLQK